ncbi:hypothetical protein MSG28_009930 [Choristoneura fumiferana]|uniref:Uncharacterized protein n=1 Tax=Choristoneura fumiferana TaxID=7141 RepID=A0ACC0JD82_CHOFU|nr:hypothetical protein MSG28_009930 [Choristoneura fumiferana]
MFQMSLGFSIVLTGVWPYLDKEVLGLAVGAAPLGQLLCSPLLGLWANRRGPRAPLLGSLALAALGSAAYASLHAARPELPGAPPSGPDEGRSLLSPSVAVARAYLSAATLEGERTRAVAAVSLAQVLGFVVGPALQAAAAPLGAGAPYGPPPELRPRLDMFTAPGWLNAALAALNLALLLPCCFKERNIAAKEAMRAHHKGSVESLLVKKIESCEVLLLDPLGWCVAEAEALALLRPDRVSSWTLVGAFFVLNFSFVLLETLCTPLTMDQFAWDKAPALRYMGALMSAGAVVACLTFALITPLTRLFQERSVATATCLPYALPLPFTICHDGDYLLTRFATRCCCGAGSCWWGWPRCCASRGGRAAAAGAGGGGAGTGAGGEARGGCPADRQPWCLTSRGLTMPQFFLGYAAMSVGYPLGVTLIQTIFSKVLGPRPQGVWMGVLTGAGCVARALGPACVALLYARRGPDAAFGVTAALTFGTLLVLRALYPRLQPPALPAAPPPPQPPLSCSP